MGWISGVLVTVAVVLGGASSGTKSTTPSFATPTYGTASCQKKRVDACGCHHVYGVRHCHPTRKSSHCEVMASSASRASDLLDLEPVDFPTFLASYTE